MESTDPKKIAAKLWAAAQGTLAFLERNVEPTNSFPEDPYQEPFPENSEPGIELKIDSVFSMPLDTYLNQEEKAKLSVPFKEDEGHIKVGEKLKPVKCVPSDKDEVHNKLGEKLKPVKCVPSDKDEVHNKLGEKLKPVKCVPSDKDEVHNKLGEKFKPVKCKTCLVVLENIDIYLMGRNRVYYRQWKRRFNRCGEKCRLKHVKKLSTKAYKKKRKEKMEEIEENAYKKYVHFKQKESGDNVQRIQEKTLSKIDVLGKNYWKNKCKLKTTADSSVHCQSAICTTKHVKDCDQQLEHNKHQTQSDKIKVKDTVLVIKKEPETDSVQAVSGYQTEISNVKKELNNIKKEQNNTEMVIGDVSENQKDEKKSRSVILEHLKRPSPIRSWLNVDKIDNNSKTVSTNNSSKTVSTSLLTTPALSNRNIIGNMHGKPLPDVKSGEFKQVPDSKIKSTVSVLLPVNYTNSVSQTSTTAIHTPSNANNYVLVSNNGSNYLLPSSVIRNESPHMHLSTTDKQVVSNILNPSQVNSIATSNVQAQTSIMGQSTAAQTVLGRKQQMELMTQNALQQLLQKTCSTKPVNQQLPVGMMLSSGQVIYNSLNQGRSNIIPTLTMKTPNLNVLPLETQPFSTGRQNSVLPAQTIILPQNSSNVLTTDTHAPIAGGLTNLSGMQQVVLPQVVSTQGLVQLVDPQIQTQHVPMIVQQQTNQVQYVITQDKVIEDRTQSTVPQMVPSTVPPTVPSTVPPMVPSTVPPTVPSTVPPTVPQKTAIVTVGNQQYLMMLPPKKDPAKVINTLKNSMSASHSKSELIVDHSKESNFIVPQQISFNQSLQGNAMATVQSNIPSKAIPTISQQIMTTQLQSKSVNLIGATKTVIPSSTISTSSLSSAPNTTVHTTSVQNNQNVVKSFEKRPTVRNVMQRPIHHIKKEINKALKSKLNKRDNDDVICIGDVGGQSPKKHPRKSRPEPRRDLDDPVDKMATMNKPEKEELRIEKIEKITQNSNESLVHPNLLPKNPTLPSGFRNWPEGATIEEKKITLPDTMLQELRQRPVSEWASVGQIIQNKMS